MISAFLIYKSINICIVETIWGGLFRNICAVPPTRVAISSATCALAPSTHALAASATICTAAIAITAHATAIPASAFPASCVTTPTIKPW